MLGTRLLSNFFVRLRYPFSLPEEISEALGIPLSNQIAFHKLIAYLRSPHCRPAKLLKTMPREEAEATFRNASYSDHFHQTSSFSYHFSEGCLEFVLLFDKASKLKRLYLRFREFPEEGGIEISLDSPGS